MSTHSDNQTDVFPQTEPPDIPSQVSSLTRSDLEHYLAWLTERDDFVLSEWQWRVLVGLGLVTEQEQFRDEWQKARERPLMVVEQGPDVAYITQLAANGEFYSAMNYPVGYRQKADDGVTYEVRQIGRDRRAWSPA